MQITIEQQTFYAATAVEPAHQRPCLLATLLKYLALQAGLAIVAGCRQTGLDVSNQGPDVFQSLIRGKGGVLAERFIHDALILRASGAKVR